MTSTLELKHREIVGSRPGPHLLVTGGVHGDEFEAMSAIRQLVDFVDPGKLSGRLTLIPVVNEPAYLRGQRTAEDGLDLARTCPGRADGSTTEQIAHALSGYIRSADLYLDLHSGGVALCLLPLVGYMLHSNEAVLAKQRRMARAFNLPLIWGTSPHLDGRSISVARDASVPAIYAEYRGSGLCNPQGVRDYVEGCLGVMAEFGMIDRPRPASNVEHFIEDARPHSGHLQICHPAPITGFFEREVELGQRLERGEPIGRIVDILGEQVYPIHAEQRGLVICVATFSRVLQGTGLAVVLETDR
ncbi:MAG: succinylglutamate desuccinylase/aspartoacylase family protein [Pirellulales bacterium]|nr:succinylglutamate desuccinylase/aspartoacylase family protein [Pirellulales bacterium]